MESFVSVENEFFTLLEDVCRIWQLVILQVEKAKQSLLCHDLDLAGEIITREKRVDAYALKIESDTVKHIDRNNPNAVDLKMTLSLKKISNRLERIGDIAEEIASQLLHDNAEKLNAQLMEDLQVERIFDALTALLNDCLSAIEPENSILFEKIPNTDDIFYLHAIYRNMFDTLTISLQSNPGLILNGLKVFQYIDKLERIGDYCRSIMEDTVIYVDAKALKPKDWIE